jgi:hypothetical protein
MTLHGPCVGGSHPHALPLSRHKYWHWRSSKGRHPALIARSFVSAIAEFQSGDFRGLSRIMDGGLATAAVAAAAAAVDVARVDAAEADATEADASRADASRATSSSETVAMYSGCGTGWAASVATSLKELTRSNVAAQRSFQLQAERSNKLTQWMLLLGALTFWFGAATLYAGVFPDKLHGKTRSIFVAVVLAVPLACFAVWFFLRWKSRSRQATDLESGGRGWFWACRYWDGVTKGSRRMRVYIYSSTRGRYGSSRLGA